MLRVLRGELGALRASGAQVSAIANKQREIYGTIYGTRRLWQRGYALEGSLRYSGGQGLDLIFRSRRGALAVLETKAGRGAASRLATDVNGLTQGSLSYILSRLVRFEDAVNPTLLSRQLFGQIGSGQVRSFASFLGSNRLYQIPAGWPSTGRLILR